MVLVLVGEGGDQREMKIQCDVCERAEALVLCCADEAALCWDCDQKVHAANKLAGKHQRLPLSHPSSQAPKCDICQVKTLQAPYAVPANMRAGLTLCIYD